MARTRQRSTGRCAALATLVALASLATAPVAYAALYKWIDANGRVVYSDQPPIGNVRTEIIGAAAPSTNPDAVKEMANKDAEFKKRQMDRAEDGKKGEKARVDAQKAAALCAQARAQVAGLRRADVAMYRLNEKGERVLLDEPARKVEADRLDQLVRERNCPPA